MRLVKLAWRIIAGVRRRFRLSTVTLAIVAALVMVGTSTIATLYRAEQDRARTVHGEYYYQTTARAASSPVDTAHAICDSCLVTARSMQAVVIEHGSTTTPGILVAATMLEELAFRALPSPRTTAPGQATEAVIVSAGIDTGTTIRLVTADGSIEAVVADSYPAAHTPATTAGLALAGTAATAPEETAAPTAPELPTPVVIVDRSAPGVATLDRDDVPVTVAVRGGTRPIARRTGNRLAAAGFEAVEWRTTAARAVAQSAGSLAGLTAGLMVIAGLVTLPALLLLVRQQHRTLVLLRTWGFRIRDIKVVVVWIDLLAFIVPSLIGLAIGSAALGIMEARGTSPGLVELLLTPAGASSSGLIIGPAVSGMAIVCAASLVLGLIAALPTLRVVDRIVANAE
jgi:hypothetical protein